MRGRTNVGGGGIALNANVVNKEIKSGNIIAGDFVQYYTEDAIIEQSARLFFEFNVNEYTVAKKGNGIALLKNNEQVDYFSRYHIDSICRYENFVLFYSYSQVIGCLAINTETDTFNLLSYETYTSSYAYAKSSIIGGNGKIIAITTGSSSSQKTQFISANISNQGIISNVVVTDPISAMIGDPFLEYYNENFYLIFLYSSSYSANHYRVNINNEGKVTLGSPLALLNAIDTLRKIEQYDNIVIYCGNNHGNNINGYIGIVDLSQGTGTKLTISGIPVTNINNHVFISKYRYGTEVTLYLYEYDNTTKEVILIDTYIYNESIGDGINIDIKDGYINNGFAIIRKNHSTSVTTYEYKIFEIFNNTYIEELADKDYVLPFSEYGHPIGVAKDPGSTGDIIGVYVPVSS